MIICSLKNKKEFDLVNKHGSKLFGSCFLIILAKDFKYIPTNASSSIFFGMKVSKKLSKKSVIRNKIKRRIRHLTRGLIHNPKFQFTNTAFIIIPQKGFETVSFKKLTANFQKIFTN